MKKILFVTNNLKDGGAEKYLVDLLKEKKKNKDLHIEILLISEYGVYLNDLKSMFKIEFVFKKSSIFVEGRFLNQKYIRKSLTFLRIIFIKFFFSFFMESKLKKYDTVVSFLEGTSTGIVKRLKNIKKIAWIHSDLREAKIYYNKKENELNYKNTQTIVCVSNTIRKIFLTLYPNYSNKVITLYNFIDSKKIIEKSNERIEYKKSRITLISIGRLSYEKNHLCLLKACKKLKEENIDFELLILGEGEKRKELENYILKNKLEKNIKILGFVKNPYPYIKISDIFVLPSLHEGYSLVLSEALVLKKLIICSNFDVAVERLKNGKLGVLFENNNYLDLYKKLKLHILSKNKGEKIMKELEKNEFESQRIEIIKKVEEIL